MLHNKNSIEHQYAYCNRKHFRRWTPPLPPLLSTSTALRLPFTPLLPLLPYLKYYKYSNMMTKFVGFASCSTVTQPGNIWQRPDLPIKVTGKDLWCPPRCNMHQIAVVRCKLSSVKLCVCVCSPCCWFARRWWSPRRSWASSARPWSSTWRTCPLRETASSKSPCWPTFSHPL